MWFFNLKPESFIHVDRGDGVLRHNATSFWCFAFVLTFDTFSSTIVADGGARAAGPGWVEISGNGPNSVFGSREVQSFYPF